MARQFDFKGIQEVDGGDVTYRIHDKWGRPCEFIFYD
jgi:hypothetical protein